MSLKKKLATMLFLSANVQGFKYLQVSFKDNPLTEMHPFYAGVKTPFKIKQILSDKPAILKKYATHGPCNLPIEDMALNWRCNFIRPLWAICGLGTKTPRLSLTDIRHQLVWSSPSKRTKCTQVHMSCN